MSTNYDVVFTAFTSKITDPIFIELPVDDSEEQMIQLLNDGLIYFKNPKVDVFDKDDFNKVFNKDLGYGEIQIIASLMKSAWLERQISSLKLIEQKFTDRDFKLTSQASHLEQLVKLKEVWENTCKKLMKNYTYSNGIAPNYNRLASDDL